VQKEFLPLTQKYEELITFAFRAIKNIPQHFVKRDAEVLLVKEKDLG
jgi:hypothetical protein